MGYTIEAFATSDTPGKFAETTYEQSDLDEFDVYVKIKACGVCHTDCLFGTESGKILGHEPVGEVVEVGSKIKKFKKGDVVGFSYLKKCCLDCALCNTGNDMMCRQRVLFPEGNNNGFAKAAVVDGRFTYKLPEGMEPKYAAPLLCAGITVYNGLFGPGVQPIDRVAVVGIGGLGHLALQFARAWGCHVTAISSTPDKKEESLKFGAHDYLSSKEFTSESIEKLKKFDYIINTVSADLDWDQYMSLLNPNGQFIMIGIPHKPIEIKNVFGLLQDQRVFRGSVVAGRAHVERMLDFAARHDIKPQIEEYEFTKEGLEKAFDRCNTNKARYRAVLVAKN